MVHSLPPCNMKEKGITGGIGGRRSHGVDAVVSGGNLDVGDGVEEGGGGSGAYQSN
jgi:hypothetical protein